MKYALLILVSQLAFGGGFVRNGAEDYAIEEGSWFSAGGPIKWCIHPKDDSGLPRAMVVAEIDKAFRTWQEYVEIKRPFAKTAPQFQLQFSYSESCDGKEDIAILLGSDSPEVLKEKERYDNPFAFAKRTSYDVKTGRGKGYIWINPRPSVSWKVYPNLFAVSLHEIGHALGCEHVEGTIMDVRIGNFLRANVGHRANPDDYQSQYNLNSLLRIDFTKELFLNAENGIKIWGYRGPPNVEINELFQTLLGLQPKGPVSIGLLQGWSDKSNIAKLYFMEVDPKRERDAAGYFKFQKWILNIKLDPILELVPISEGRVFKVQKTQDDVVFERVRGYLRTGMITLPSGKEIPILYNRNRADDTVVDLHILIDGRYRPLFKASPLQQLGDQRVFKD